MEKEKNIQIGPLGWLQHGYPMNWVLHGYPSLYPSQWSLLSAVIPPARDEVICCILVQKWHQPLLLWLLVQISPIHKSKHRGWFCLQDPCGRIFPITSERQWRIRCTLWRTWANSTEHVPSDLDASQQEAKHFALCLQQTWACRNMGNGKTHRHN